jgi:hypothetical protein
MIIDPGNKCFIGVFATVVLATIGFLIASIFIDVGGDLVLQKIEFQRSPFSMSITQLKADKSYAVQVFNGELCDGADKFL